ncbi:protein SIEVE ELEMENT OCCLUSION B-like [Gastrolobium bilobum]|uniref:protein SIEVE ELEMENT OCCLUSION B-like n=1 Tax=Gastrolobium bilobum TaxID=150636 RepID=UPI002AB04A63|nr:protein SIEVE ELEMENT OCCLUSION B-like [Gastrolobium bilobum]
MLNKIASVSRPFVNTATAGSQSKQESVALGALVTLNPFIVSDDEISNKLKGIHDSQAARQDVASLYNVVKNIVTSESLDLKSPKPIELVQEVPKSGFMPTNSMLKEIVCQMTCKAVDDASKAHVSVMEILKMLNSYTWDVKAVIVLTAFAWDYGENWRVFLTKGATKDVLNVFSVVEPIDPKAAALTSNLVNLTLQLIDLIIELEDLFSNKAYTAKDVPALHDATRGRYTYWAILALLACANQNAESYGGIKHQVLVKLQLAVLPHANATLVEIKCQIEILEVKNWRINVFHNPTDILELLRALIFPRYTEQLEIFDNTANKRVEAEVLKTKNLFLFISGLEDIEYVISVLRSIHDSLTKEEDKHDYKILWIPVVKEWNEAKENKFLELNAQMPWYVVHYFSLIEGIECLQDYWMYLGKPILVVTDPHGKVTNKNAMPMVKMWGMEAFPFGALVPLPQQWKWFWNIACNINADIEKWKTQENTYIFIYGGGDSNWTQEFSIRVDAIKNDSNITKAGITIETVLINIKSKFWEDTEHLFLDMFQKDHSMGVVKDILTLFSMQTEEGWAILSRGEKVLKIDCNGYLMKAIREFDEWKKNLPKQTVEVAVEGHIKKKGPLPLHCRRIQYDNIHFDASLIMPCPEPTCEVKKMEIESVTVRYKCCHGEHDHGTENGEVHHPPELPKTN